MKKRLLSALLALTLTVGLLPGTAWTAETESTTGSCGTNATWEFNTTTGTLTISGHGDMTDYATSWGSNAPWSGFMDSITSVVVSNGITHIGAGAFGGDMVANQCENLTTVSLPGTLKSIGALAFAGSAITSVILPDGLTSIGNGAFNYTNLTSISIPTSVTHMGDTGWFSFDCFSLTQISVAAGNQYFEVENNILYSKGKTELIFYPYQYSATSYTIPSTVKTLEFGTFLGHRYLKGLVIPTGTKLTMGPDSGPDGLYYDLSQRFSLYFYGSAPDNLEDFWFYNSDGALCGVDFYYVAGASGWDAYKSEDYYDAEEKGYWFTFQQWIPQNLGTATITRLYPANGATDVQYNTAAVSQKFQITFDREIASISEQEYVADVDLMSDGAFAIYRASDDQLISEPNQYSAFNYGIAYDENNTKRTLSIQPPYSGNGGLQPNTTYYITMGEGFVRFADGTMNQEIKKGDWTFTTKPLTLSLHGSNFEMGVDSLNFDNEEKYFGDNACSLTDEDALMLGGKLSPSDAFKVFSNILSGDVMGFQGECFGMSALMGLIKAGKLSTNAIQSGAINAINLVAPKYSKRVASIVYYYHLLQVVSQFKEEDIDNANQE